MGSARLLMPDPIRTWFVYASEADRAGDSHAARAQEALEKFGEHGDSFAAWVAGISDVESLPSVREVAMLIDRLLVVGWDLRYDGWAHFPRVVPRLGLLGVPSETTAKGWLERNQWILAARCQDEWAAWDSMLHLSNDYDEWSRHYASFDVGTIEPLCEKMDQMSTLALGVRYPSHLDFVRLPFTRSLTVGGVRAPKSVTS